MEGMEVIYGLLTDRLILMVVLPLLQFCSKAFGDYAAQSEVIDILFSF